MLGQLACFIDKYTSGKFVTAEQENRHLQSLEQQ